MGFKDKREDAMLEAMAWKKAYLVRVGEGIDPKWLEVKAEKDAAYAAWQLESCPSFKGVKTAWPRNLAVFGSKAGAAAGKKRLEEAGIVCGDVLTGAMLPGKLDVKIKGKA